MAAGGAIEQRCAPLIEFLWSARSYLCHLGKPLHVSRSLCGSLHDLGRSTERRPSREIRQRLIESLGARLGFPPPVFVDDPGASCSPLEQLVGCRVSELVDDVFSLDAADHDAAAAAERCAAEWREATMQLRPLTADGPKLTAAVRGASAGAKAVVLVGPCGLPTAILRKWFDALERDHLVTACETRGFSAEDVELEDCPFSVEAQARDVVSLMDQLGIARGHVMGICGGAVVALQAAVLAPERVESLSLWYGDFNVGDDRYFTRYQKDLRWLMGEGARSRDDARLLYPLVSSAEVVDKARRDIAHLVLFPYSTPELFYRYSRANGAIMETDVASLARRVSQPTWVITSASDQTAHPMGSRIVASLLPVAQLLEADGDHLTCLDAPRHVQAIAARILLGEHPSRGDAVKSAGG